MERTCWFGPKNDRQQLRTTTFTVPDEVLEHENEWTISNFIGCSAINIASDGSEFQRADLPDVVRQFIQKIINMAALPENKGKILCSDYYPAMDGYVLQKMLEEKLADETQEMKPVIMTKHGPLKVYNRDMALGVYYALKKLNHPDRFLWIRIAGVMDN